ncbi:bifunctional UDP-N-acetylglucosamine diphosphorylase/glucosamine-1-phosphate N-acetyltransferase GlmU [Phaeobacter sp.]|uniref:bifunctional UDP-N-acetylglucosamine diphosphorylase/glucosamine-1-phosphate N-acetyltransferase GlmU n=1 Tax=Phaeobacter sp. TaxID=1902409 RepID=UPI0025E7E89D|nr:bifunctional UDP-N-acetylglucosamine diphosphorylase/glucosamine-1-phosphate N-acetyltransferase GlmU [Phaeobacter sp.]
MSTALVILAAGKGTRMNSDLPKVLHPIAHAPMLQHALVAGQTLQPERTIVIAGHGAETVRTALAEIDEDVEVIVQEEQLGTAHAVAQARDALAGFAGNIVVLYGDTPFVSADTLERMIEAHSDADLVVLGFTAADPGRYGRLVMDGNSLERIVEYKDATDAERQIDFCNSGLMAGQATQIFDLIDKVDCANASGEYYLTDLVGLARAEGLRVTAISCDEAETLGVNSRVDLAQADQVFQARTRMAMMEDGVTLMAPETVYFAFDTVIGRDSVIEPNVVFGPGVTVESGAQIRAFSHLEGCHVSRGSKVGPYARLRPGAELAEDTHIGNFVEIKNAEIAAGAKVNHLSYIGDASVGEKTNIGAGTITCNYDGVMKHRTEIGARSFIGSNTMLIAPVSVGNEAMTATGTIVTKNIEDGALALGRAEQENKPGRARKLMDILRAKKARLKKGAE